MEKFTSQFTAIEIENRLKDVTSKAGYFYFDETNNKYLVFADENTKNIYLDTQNPSLIIGELSLSEKEPETYAEIYLDVPMYNVVAYNSKNNRLAFTFDIKNKQGNSTGEEIIVKYNITNGNHVTELTESKFFGQQVELAVDKYLKEGTNTIFITITSKISKATTSVSVIYNAISISIEDYLDISKVYDLSNNKEAYLEIPYNVSGSHTKLMEWYLDGELLELNRSEDEILETVPVSRTKTIKLSNLSHGRHNIQFRVSTKVNGEIFYSNTLYRDFFVYTGLNDHIMLGVAVTLPNTNEINGGLVIPNMIQYEGYELKIASYSPLNIAKTNINILLDQENINTISSSNNKVTNITITPITPGSKELKLIANEIELESQIEYLIPTTIAATSMNLTEITSGLELDFLAKGYNNNSSNRDQWSQNDILGTLTGFKWNNTSGWVNNRLEIDADSEIHFNYSPLSDHTNGKTIEIEWMSKNVSNEDAILCDLTNEEGTGILITASSIIVTSKGKTELVEKYKRDENIRAGIVINPSNRGTNKGLIFIYVNGIVSRAINYLSGDNFISNKELYFKGTSEAGVSLKAIKVYGEALTSDQMLNNYNLYRDTVSEMYEVYDRNNIYEDNKISPSKMNGRLPVMIVTGDIPTLENTNDKDTQIVVDIEYTNMQDPSRSFKMKGAAMRPQGTSSMGYPKKNFRIYTQKLDSTILEVNGSIVENKLYSFKKGAIPVNCWCLKADYAESSGTHNTGIAKLWGNAFKNALVTCDLGEDNPHSVREATVLRTRAQQCAIDNGYPYDVRTTIDGFPILLFYRRTEQDDIIFIGKYNFNNDKSTELVFGFKDIPGFNNSRMQCWEFLNNGNPIGLFTDISAFYNDVIDDKGKTKKGWEIAFEARYPDKSTNTTDLFNFAKWINGVNGNHEKFLTEKWEHLDVYKVAGYYCYLNRHAAADQFVKNAMLTSEDGIHFYFILYDNDTINGLNNTGDIAILPTDDRESTYADGSHKFAGYDSVLWNMLENDEEFMVVVRAVDNALYQANISYGSAINTFNNEQADKWVEKVYNLDAEYKYITPYTQNGINNLFMLQGKREVHRKWWLSNRFSLYDSLFVSGTYKSGYIEIKCIDETQPVQTFKVTSGYPLYYGYGINGNLRQRTDTLLQPNESHIFSIDEKVNLGDPIAIYGAPHIKELDLSSMVDRIAVLQLAGVYNNDLGTKLEKLIIGSNSKENIRLQEVSGIKKAVSLTYLDITNLKGLTGIDLSENIYLKELRAKGTNLYAINFAEGSPINYLELPATLKNIDFKSLAELSFDNIKHENFNAVEAIKIIDCPNLSNDFNWVYNWYTNKTISNNKAVLEIDNIAWEGVNYTQLLELANIGTLRLKGKVVISEGSQEIIDSIKAVFGDTVFNKTSDFYVQAPDGVYLSGPSKLLEGESARFVCAVFSDEVGRIQFSLMTSRTGCSIDKFSGVLTTTENGLATSDIEVRAVFITDSGQIISTTQTVTIEKRTYPTAIEITGDALISTESHTFNLVTTPAEVTGLYTINWALAAEAAEYLEIESFDNTSCTLKRIKEGVVETTLIATMIKNVDSSTVITTTRNISVVMEGVVITKSSNAPLQECLYKNGLVSHEDYSEAWELALISSDQLLSNGASIFRPYRSSLLSLEEFKYFTGLWEIPNSLFNYGSNGYEFSTIVIPEGVKRIGERAFYYCKKLKDITIPKSIEVIEKEAFYYAHNIECIRISDLKSYCKIKFNGSQANPNSTYNGEVLVPNRQIIVEEGEPNVIHFKEDITIVGYPFHRFKNIKWIFEEITISIPERTPYGAPFAYISGEFHFNGNFKVTGAQKHEFYQSILSSINEIHISSKYTDDFFSSYIGESTTCESLEKITVSEDNPIYQDYEEYLLIDKLDNSVIKAINTDGDIVVPEGILKIKEYCFYYNKMKSCTLPNSLKEIGKYAFYRCTEITEINLPNSLEIIGDHAFYYCLELTGIINIGSNVTTIGQLAFYNTSITGYNFPSLEFWINIQLDDQYRFYYNNLIYIDGVLFDGNLVIPENIKDIKSSHFRGCTQLKSITLHDGLTIGYGAFMNCSGVEGTIEIPKNCTIQGECFSGCTAPEIIIDSDLFYDNITVSSGQYMGALAKKITLTESVTKIGYQSFSNCTNLEEIVILGKIERINYYAFSNCTSLKKVTISSLDDWCNIRIESDNSSPFFTSKEGDIYVNDTLLTNVIIPDNVTVIPSRLFRYCKSIESLTIHANVSKIDNYAFSGCVNLKTIKTANQVGPVIMSTTFGSSESDYAGRNTYNTGENILYVPQGATGYDSGYWLDPLQNTEKCGFTISYTL